MHAPKRKRHSQRLDLDKAREIRRLRNEEGMSVSEMAKLFGIPRSTVEQVLRGETWRETTLFPKRRPISQEQAAEIRRLAANNPGLSQERIGFLVGVSGWTVRKVLKAR
jgi:DNA invertase Pin-like site-specific DNA recombinase